MSRQMMYVLENRDENGKMVFDGPRPPFSVASQNRIFDLFFDHNQEVDSAEWGEVVEWLKTKGWSVRPKTW